MNDPLGLFDEDTKGNDPLGLFEEKAGIGTGIKSSFANVGNMADTAFSTLAGGAAALFGDDQAAIQIEEEMRNRLKSREQWANPERKEISGTGKLAGAVATLPMQILGMGLSPADTALKAKDAGETNTKAIQAAGLDAAGNIAGMMLPGFKQGSMAVRGATGFGANAAQDYATKSVIQDVLETEAGKKIFAPTLEDALISGVIGAGSAAALGRNKVSGEKAKLDALIERQKAIDAKKAVEAPAPMLKNQSSLEGEDGQMSLFDQQDMVQNRQPYQAEFGDWRIDENGMPIKADLSMELQNLQQPLQRNFWGDELPPKSEQEAFPLTQAIDEMPDAPWRNERDEGLDLLRGEIEAPGELKSAMMQSESLPANVRSGDPSLKVPFNFKKQGGALDPEVFKEGYVAAAKALSRLTDVLASDKTWQNAIRTAFNGEFKKNADGTPMVMLHGTAVPFEGDILGSSQGIHAGFATSPHMFTTKSSSSKAYLDPKSTKENANIRPIVLKEGNYPFIKVDAGDWTPYKVFDHREIGWLIQKNLLEKGYTDSDIQGFKRYVSNQPEGSKQNQAFSDILKRAGIDGFFYKNEAESPHLRKESALKIYITRFGELSDSKKKTWERVQSKSQDPTSFVTWNNSNIKSVFDTQPRQTIRSPGNKQRGGLLIDPNKGDQIKTLEESLNKLQQKKLTLENSNIYKRLPFQEKMKVLLPIVDEIGKLNKELANIYEQNRNTRFQEELDVVKQFNTQVGSFIAEDQRKGFKLISKRQKGGLLIDPKARAREQIESVVGKKASAIPDNPVAADVVAQALSEGKDGKGVNMLQSGSTSTAMKRGSAAIEGASRIIQNAVKRADLAIRDNVFPAENSLRKLPLEQLQSLADVFKAEMLSNTKFDGQAMAESGFSVDQIKAYTAIRQMFDDTLRVQNEARVAQGKKPIDAKEAYVSSRWQGDFRRPVYDKEGNLKWYLAADTRNGLEAQTKALLKEFPDLVVDKAKDHVVKASNNKTDLQSMYSTMLDILGRDDPAVERIKQAVEEQTIAQGQQTLGQQKHFKQKTNVRGFVGDRPGSSPKREALALFQEQMQYAKNAYKWAEFQKAADDIKTIVGDADLQQQQPNNVQYIRDYWKNALGYGEAKAITAIEDGVRSLGFSPQIIKNGVGSVKSFFILQKLAASTGYTAANLIQTSNVIPYMAYLSSQGYKGNPLKALSMGLLGGFAMGTGHYLTSAGGDYAKVLKGWPDSEFYTNAFKYAEDNGVTARSVYDESPVETSFSKVGQAANLAGKTMTVPETFVRAMAYMTYVQQLKDSGKFKTDEALFQKAEELVNMSMVDYRETERPLMFSKMGTTGNFLNTLQTFPMSFYNQWNFYAREAAKGNVGPLLSAIVLQGTIAGAMGIPGFDDLEKLYMFLKDSLPAKEWQKLQESEFFADPKMWMLKNLGQSAVYGVLSDKTGLGMTSRVAAPGAGAMLQSPAGPITDIAKQAMNVGKAALDPTNTTKLAQAAMSVAPVGLQGALETAPFMEGITHNGANYLRSTDLADRKGGYVRTPEEEAIRKWGFRSQKEVATRDITYAQDRASKTAREKSQTIPDKFYDALRRGKIDEAKELNIVYTKLTGKSIDDKQMENQIREEMFDAVQRSKNAAKSLEAIKNIKRMDDLLKEIQ